MGNIKLHSLNDVKLVGRLTRDPELRYTTQGTAVCHFRIAVGRKYKDRVSGEWKEEVAFVPCNVWRETAERCGQRLKKGSPVFVEGRLKSREWQTKEGQKRNDLEVEIARVQFLESMGEAGGEVAEAVGG
jgi:single-strand DNA-binding protein